MTPTAPSPTRRPYAARVPMEERREQLLDAAIRVIVRNGYDSVSIDAIAREAGVTRPVVYGAFHGLGDLLGRLLDRQKVRALGQLMSAIPDDTSDATPEELITRTVRALIDCVSTDHLTWQPILLAPDGTPPEVRTRIEADRERVREQLAGVLDDFLPRITGATLDTEVMSHALLAVAEHFGRLLLEDPHRLDPERLVSSVLAVVGLVRSP